MAIFKGLQTTFASELSIIQRQYPFEEFQFLETSLILEFKDAVSMLRGVGVVMDDFDDLKFVTLTLSIYSSSV